MGEKAKDEAEKEKEMEMEKEREKEREQEKVEKALELLPPRTTSSPHQLPAELVQALEACRNAEIPEDAICAALGCGYGGKYITRATQKHLLNWPGTWGPRGPPVPCLCPTHRTQLDGSWQRFMGFDWDHRR